VHSPQLPLPQENALVRNFLYNIKDLIKFLKQKKMRNKLMHIRNCEVPADMKQMAKGIMLARPTFAA
jgi:hypothetical protein